MNARIALVSLCMLTCLAGCVSRPPSIAHVHLGHALTGVRVTPNHVGYLMQAEDRAKEAISLAQQAEGARELADIKKKVAGVVEATDSSGGFGLKQSLVLAANHISFAATSADASTNLQQSAPVFIGNSARVIERCELIRMLGDDVAASTSVNEALVSAEEIRRLAEANLWGDDRDGNGRPGSTPFEYGFVQLRKEVDGIVAREDPPYAVVDRWYLFNLVKLPSGRWVFDRLGRTGNEGYR
jgi:hypothetical protein